MSPIVAIEQIARSEDRARAIVFFLFFARFEYALKRAGFTSKKEEAIADWTKYARSFTNLLTKTTRSDLREPSPYCSPNRLRSRSCPAGDWLGVPIITRDHSTLPAYSFLCAGYETIFFMAGSFQKARKLTSAGTKSCLMQVLSSCRDASIVISICGTTF
jgi:hypothetical protein